MRGLYQGFAHAVRTAPDAPALHLRQERYSYRALDDLSAGLTARFREIVSAPRRIVALVETLDVHTYAAALAVPRAGATYIPVRADTPARHLRQILRATMPDVLAGRWESVTRAGALVPPGTAVVATDTGQAIGPAQPSAVSEPTGSGAAYVVFTSGSTGTPKGVPVSEENLAAFLGNARSLFGFARDDVVLQPASPAFDLSVLSIYGTWDAGACVAPALVPELALAPARMMAEMGVTVWVSVPSVVSLIGAGGRMRDRTLDRIRLSIFCGEALLERQARWWSAVAPKSRLLNTYGPSEATVACTIYEWAAGSGRDDDSAVPIGFPFPGMQLRVAAADEDGLGELEIAGPQVFAGYLGRAGTDGDGRRFYRTGDLARRDRSGVLHFVDRLDRQVKVLGHRLELAEVEAAIRRVTRVTEAAVVAMPDAGSGAGWLAAAVVTPAVDAATLRRQLQEFLPAYALPKRIVAVPSLPRGDNGKVDPAALRRFFAGSPLGAEAGPS